MKVAQHGTDVRPSRPAVQHPDPDCVTGDHRAQRELRRNAGSPGPARSARKWERPQASPVRGTELPKLPAFPGVSLTAHEVLRRVADSGPRRNEEGSVGEDDDGREMRRVLVRLVQAAGEAQTLRPSTVARRRAARRGSTGGLGPASDTYFA